MRAAKTIEVKLIKNPSADGIKDALKNIFPDYEQVVDQMLNGTYEVDNHAGISKPGNKSNKGKK